MVPFLRVWQPDEPLLAEGARRPARDRRRRRPRRRARGGGPAPRGHRARHAAATSSGAYAPYLIIIVVFALAQSGPIKDLLAKGEQDFSWPGLDILNAKGEAPTSVTYKFNWLPAAGTLLLICGLITMLVLRVPPRARCAPTGARSTS